MRAKNLRGFKLGQLPQHRYFSAFGNESNIFLLRSDTTGFRFRVIADVFSLQTLRIKATRTLLDLPLGSAMRIDRVVWDPNLSSIALRVQRRGRTNDSIHQTTVVDLLTGLPRKIVDDKVWSDSSVPLCFSDDGQRLVFAASVSADTAAKNGFGYQLFVADLVEGRVQSLGSPALPTNIPVFVSRNTHWAVYSYGKNIEVWNTVSGRKYELHLKSNHIGSPERCFRFRFATDDSWFAHDDGTSLRMYSAETGSLLEAFPTIEQTSLNGPLSFQTIFSEHADSILTLSIEANGLGQADSPQKANRDDAGLPSLRRISIGGTDKEPHSEGGQQEPSTIVRQNDETEKADLHSDALFSSWMSALEYSAFFQRLTTGRKYPITVEGRFHLGQRQYRAIFVDRPEKHAFFTHHDQSKDAIDQLAQRHQQNGFREIWRHSFADDEGMTWWSAVWTKDLGAR